MVPASTAVERLAKLLADETRLEEKIRDTKAALSIVQKECQNHFAKHYIAMKEPRIQMPEDLMREEESFERLLQALQDMKSEIAKQIRPVEEQIIQANVDHLRQTFTKESRRLCKCLEEIDDNILACRQYLEDYERIRSNLHNLNERDFSARRGVACAPDGLPTLDLGEIVRERIEYLRSQEKSKACGLHVTAPIPRADTSRDLPFAFCRSQLPGGEKFIEFSSVKPNPRHTAQASKMTDRSIAL